MNTPITTPRTPLAHTPRTGMGRALAAAALLTGALALGGCAHNPSNAQVGTGVGAVAGGLVGNAVFGSTMGTVGGAAAGALIGNEVGKNSDRDRNRGRRR